MRHDIDGIRYHVETDGEGFPAILLHGFTGDSSTWHPFYENWGRHSKLVSIDMIGHGKSDSPETIERYRIMSVVDDLFELMEKLRIPKADFIGYSMGGRIALSFAVKYPTKVRKLVLESSSPGLMLPQEREARIEQDGKLASFIKNNGIEAFVDYWTNIPLFESQKRLPMDKQKQILKQRLNNSIIGLANSLRGMGTGVQPSWWDEIANLQMEVLLITGSLDKKFCQIAGKMAERLEKSEVVNIHDCGHAIHVEEPEKFGTIVSGFLSNSQ